MMTCFILHGHLQTSHEVGRLRNASGRAASFSSCLRSIMSFTASIWLPSWDVNGCWCKRYMQNSRNLTESAHEHFCFWTLAQSACHGIAKSLDISQAVPLEFYNSARLINSIRPTKADGMWKKVCLGLPVGERNCAAGTNAPCTGMDWHSRCKGRDGPAVERLSK